MLHNFGTRNIEFRPKTQVLQLWMSCRLAKCSETPANIILGPMDQNGCFTTLVPRNSAFRLEHKFCILYVPKVSEIIKNTREHDLGPMD
jgi:hypothetical protein